MIKKTGMVNAGFNKYLIDGFNIGIPPTVAILIKKNTMLTNIKQNPIEYMSSLLNLTAIFPLSLSKNLGSMVDPIKKAMNAIISVVAKLVVTEFIDSNRNMENNRITINGLKM